MNILNLLKKEIYSTNNANLQLKLDLIKKHPHWEEDGKRRKKYNNYLVYVSKHNGACEICSKFQGKVYIDDIFTNASKSIAKYPLLSDAIKSGLFHDGCKHGLSTYFEGINDKV